MKDFVVIESPYAGNVEENLEYARKCMTDSLTRGEVPFASHLLYTQKGILNDELPEERAKGIVAGLTIAEHASATIVYIDKGISKGMQEGIKVAKKVKREVIFRSLERDISKSTFIFSNCLIEMEDIVGTNGVNINIIVGNYD